MGYIKNQLWFAAACVMIAFFMWLVVYLPPYEKYVYAKSPVIRKEQADRLPTKYTGYQGDHSIKRLTKLSDLTGLAGQEEDLWDFDESKLILSNVVLEINSDRLEATGIYQCLEESAKIETNRMKVSFLRTMKNYGQYYIATLESGEKLPVLINDFLIDVKKSGTLILPIGYGTASQADFKTYGVDPSYRQQCLDTASGFAEGNEMKRFRRLEMGLVTGIILLIFFLMLAVFIRESVHQSRNGNR